MTGPNNYEKAKVRRQNLSAEEVEQMKAEEAAGKSRKEISIIHNCTPASVTRKLGAVQQYKGRRTKVEEPQPA
jgi:hypothetical protein